MSTHPQSVSKSRSRRSNSLDRLEYRIHESYRTHPERHTRRHRLRILITATALYLVAFVLWSAYQVRDTWSEALASWGSTAIYLILVSSFVLFIITLSRLTIALDGVNRLPVDRLDELQREVRQRSSDLTLNIVTWSVIIVFLVGLSLQYTGLSPTALANLLICGVYALLGISTLSFHLFTALWLPGQEGDELPLDTRAASEHSDLPSPDSNGRTTS